MGGLQSACPTCRIASSEKPLSKRLPSRSTRTASAIASSTVQYPEFKMSEEFKESLQQHFRNTLLEQRPDVFHKTMLLCIQSSPKLNEIIACQMYCFRDLTKWPKLHRLCQAQLLFYERLIHQISLDESALPEAVYQLGRTHFQYAQYGLKPHFLDLWKQHFEQFLMKLRFNREEDKDQFIAAFRQLNNYVTELMNLAYSRCQQESTRLARLPVT